MDLTRILECFRSQLRKDYKKSKTRDGDKFFLSTHNTTVFFVCIFFFFFFFFWGGGGGGGGETKTRGSMSRVMVGKIYILDHYVLLHTILLPQALSNDPQFIQFIYYYSHASKRFVEV